MRNVKDQLGNTKAGEAEKGRKTREESHVGDVAVKNEMDCGPLC